MTAVSAHDALAVRICKAYGCEQEVRDSTVLRGPYANLCEEHYQAQRRRFSAIHSGEGDPGLEAAVELPELQTNGRNGHRNGDLARSPTSYAARARTLVELGRKVDIAFGRAEKAKRDCEPRLRSAHNAKAAAEALAEQFRAAVRELAA